MSLKNWLDITGDEAGHLTVICLVKGTKCTRQEMWKCVCECGRTVEKRKDVLRGRDKDTLSCGECGLRRKACSKKPEELTVEEIWRRAAEIRDEWDADTERSRRVETFRNPPVEFQVTRLEF